jgi:hypothetical protein
MTALATAAMAVSVIVTSPTPSLSPALETHRFTTASAANLASSVQNWAQENGLASAQIDPRVAALSVGNLTVKGGTVCDAVARLVSALKYAEARPQLESCDAAPGGRIVVGSAQR